MTQFTGIIRIKVNGDLFATLPGKTLATGGVTRTDVRPDTGIGGHFETPVPSELELKVAHNAGVSVAAINALVGATLEYETDTGVTLVVDNAYTAEPCTLADGGEGLTFKMMGDEAKEL